MSIKTQNNLIINNSNSSININSSLITNNNNTNNSNNNNAPQEENITCYIRCKPLSDNEKEMNVNCIEINENKKNLTIKNSDNIFNYDKIYGGDTTQENIFNEIGLPVLENFLSGYNATIFAYGQTGTGKTYTMLGPLDFLFEENNKNCGLIPNILNYLFNKKDDVKNLITNSVKEKNINNVKYYLSCSCVEIYQEHLIDLLSSNTNEDDEALKIREDSKKGMYIENLTEKDIDNVKSAKEALIIGFKNRHVASTNMNRESSRSHLIYTLFLVSTFDLAKGLIITRTSRLHLVDLAGSERQKFTNSKGERIKEAGNINKSLSTLGNVINALIDTNDGKKKFVPFRDSKLTYYLKDSLGGNSKTVIIGNINQSYIQVNETLGTLNFIQRAKMIKNKTKIIENVNDVLKLIQNENKSLKTVVNDLKENNNKLQSELNEKIKLIENLNITISHLKNANNLLTTPTKKLTQQNSSIKKDKKVQQHTLNTNINASTATNITKKLNKELILNTDYSLENTTESIETNNNNQSNAIITSTNNNIVINTNNNTIINTTMQNIIDFKEIDELINKVNKILAFEKNINENFKFLGMNNISSIQNFLVKKEVYENELKNLIDDIANNKDNFESFDNLNINQLSQNKYNECQQNNDLNNKLMKNKIKIFTLEQENKKLFQENEVYKSITEFFVKQSNIDEKKENLSKEIIDKFINTNNQLINFFSEKIDTSKDYYMVSKKYIEKINFQLEDLKMENEKLIKSINLLQNENFLINMELSKYKDNSNDKNDNKFMVNLRNSILKNKSPKDLSAINIPESLNEIDFLINKNDKLINDINEIFISEVNQHELNLKNERNFLNNFIKEIYIIFDYKDNDINISNCLDMLNNIHDSLEIYKLLSINKKE